MTGLSSAGSGALSGHDAGTAQREQRRARREIEQQLRDQREAPRAAGDSPVGDRPRAWRDDHALGRCPDRLGGRHAPGRSARPWHSDLGDRGAAELLGAGGLLSHRRRRKPGVAVCAGRRVSVTGLEAQPPHRLWADIRQQIVEAPLPTPLRNRVLAVFTALAEAEATVHGTAVDAVHFHEVGAVDALVDVVGVCAALEQLNPARICCSPLPAGRGTVRTAHGLLPVPVPAVLELARRYRVPLHNSVDGPDGELVTPTGLALMAVLADDFAAPASFTPANVGIGLGHRELDRPNAGAAACLRPLIKTARIKSWRMLRDGSRLWCRRLGWMTPRRRIWRCSRNALREAGAVDVAAHPFGDEKRTMWPWGDRPGGGGLRATTGAAGLVQRRQQHWSAGTPSGPLVAPTPERMARYPLGHAPRQAGQAARWAANGEA